MLLSTRQNSGSSELFYKYIYQLIVVGQTKLDPAFQKPYLPS
jgi:hypothetical protein